MADYFYLAAIVFIVNIVPIFAPPTWVVLALAKISDPSFDILLLTLLGAIFSTLGRAVLAFYSSFFRRFFTKKLAEHAEEIKEFFKKKNKALFFGTLLYSLSPFPSNILFIAEGLTKVDPKPIFAGFFVGRLISYYVLIAVSHNLFAMLSEYASGAVLFGVLDLIGVAAAVSILLIDWKKVFKWVRKRMK
jgi:uncharacterized membrane protein YdjX (TVP38/TMEM64 family)